MNDYKTTQGHKVLIVEDDEGLARLLADETSDAGLHSKWVKSAEKALPILSDWEPDLVVSDLRLPGADGMELLTHTRTMHARPGFLVITAFGTISQAVDVLKAGADDFLTKPLDLDHFMHRVVRILETRRLREEVNRFRQMFSVETFHGMYGQSRSMRILFDQILQVAAASGPVLIVGESGSGKELVARALHNESSRKDGPFLAVNCAGIPETLMESEFFGHTAGSFTGAQKARQGIFAEAEGGTLLLDEIAEMPLPLQAKLLRILQDGTFRPIGSNREQQVDVRVIAATHQDLEEEVKNGRFRQDLFYRLETFTLEIPPLRDRAEDIEMLAGRFLTNFATHMGKRINGFSDEAMAMLQRYPFPGNVREFQNAIERAVTFCNTDRITIEHLPERIREYGPARSKRTIPGLYREGAGDPLPSLAEIEQRYIEHVLDQVNGNKKRAADILGVARRTLYRRLA
ncbi:MAG: sigma-54 dependent transcriptional regulator [Desulfosalsimonadaceae bacterium]